LDLLVDGDRLVAATDNGVYARTDGEWLPIPGLRTWSPSSLAHGPAGELLVGTSGHGLFRERPPQ